jgi:hypothetical protein
MARQIEKAAENAETKETTASADARAAPLLKSAALTWNSDNFVWRDCLVRLPKEAILQDLNVPEIWWGIQSTPQKALRPLDRVTAISFDGSFIVKDVLVIEADHQRAVLAIRPSDVVRVGQGRTAEWQDDRFIVKWSGVGFHAVRKSDGVEVLPAHFTTLDAAKGALFQEHYVAKRVA